MRRRSWMLCFLGALLLLAALAPAHAAPRYRITDLGPGTPRAINALGDVVGLDQSAAVLWSRGRRIVLPPLAPGAFSDARDVNDFGLVVGLSANRAVLWRAGRVQALPHADGVTGSLALGVNNLGEVAGRWDRGASYAVRWRGRGAEEFARSSGFSDIAEDGTLLYLSGVLQEGSRRRALEIPPPPGADPRRDVGAYRINRRGQVAGTSWFVPSEGLPRDYQAFLHDGHGTRYLPAESFGRDLNARGDLVGSAGGRAFLLTARDGFLDLNRQLVGGGDWTLQEATAINDLGLIAGFGTRGGARRAFLLTPAVARYVPPFRWFRPPGVNAGALWMGGWR